MLRRVAIVVVTTIGLLAACNAAPVPSPAQTAAPLAVPPLASSASSAPAPTASAPPRAVADAAPPQVDCSGDFPGGDMLRDNIAATSFSGLGEIVAVTKTGTNGQTPAPTTGYANLKYDVKIVKWFTGAGPERLVLHQGVEASYNPTAGDLLFFSACALGDGSGSEPDVGYFFAVGASCRAHAEIAGEAAAKRAKAVGKKNRACKRP